MGNESQQICPTKEQHQQILKEYKPIHIQEIRRLGDKGLEIGLVLYRVFLTICGGALVISMSTFKAVFPHGQHLDLLALSWLGFGITIVLTLAEALLSSYSLRFQIKLMDRYFRELVKWQGGDYPQPKKTKSLLFIYILQGALIVVFILSCVLMGAFVYINYHI